LTTKLSPISGNYARIFKLDADMEQELKEIRAPLLKIHKVRQGDAKAASVFQKKGKGKDEMDFDPDSEGDDDDGNYVDMVRLALKDTRRILGEITEGSALWEQIHEVFNLFSGSLGDDEGVN
jgi:hypothetical protein